MLSRGGAKTIASVTAQSCARISTEAAAVLAKYDIVDGHDGIFVGGKWIRGSSTNQYKIMNPTTGKVLSSVNLASGADYVKYEGEFEAKRREWQNVPTPVRGEIVRQIGAALREEKEDLAKIISLEMGKIYPEALGEVQEAIDVCDYALGLSRSIGGSVIPSERPEHFMMERWLPLSGNVGVITAFNFPCAVFFWNAAISLVCGNANVLKPALSGSLIAIACTKVVDRVLAKHGFSSLNGLFLGDSDVGKAIVDSHKTSLVSFTGSTNVGRQVGVSIAQRFGKHILELGGNNAMVVMPDADIDMVTRAAVFSAVGTTGQRCTSLRRLYVHEDVYQQVIDGLVAAYKTVPIGNPLDAGVLCGPLHNKMALDNFQKALAKVPTQGGKILYGGERLDSEGYFVTPAIATMPVDAPMVKEELFAPLLYVMKFKTFSEAVKLNNEVEHGLSSCLFTKNQAAVFQWTGPSGSDCGIANINIGTSGAEIGGAFGGEKATGGGRESGSDAWKSYMRRQTITVNHSKALPLAQGISFGDTGASKTNTTHPAFDL